MGDRLQSGRVIATSIARILPFPAPLVFGILSDTNRWDRLMAPPTRYTVEALDPAQPSVRTRVGRIGRGKNAVAFVEEGEMWAPRRVYGERQFLGAMGRRVKRAFLEVEARADGDRTVITMRGGAEVATLQGWLFGILLWLHTWVRLRRYVRGVERALARVPADLPDAPPAALARRALLAVADAGTSVSGRHTATGVELPLRAERFSGSPVDAGIRDRILALLTDQPDETLASIRPFEIATAWGADRREVLRGFLHAAHAGLFDLEWQIDCPTCRVGADWTPQLSRLGQRVHCQECDISFDVDFADNVEATFTVNPAVRKVSRVIWCASSPFWRPHVHGYLMVAPRTVRVVGPLPDGPLLFRTRGGARRLRIEDGQRPLAVRITDDAILERPPGDGVRELAIENATDQPVRLLVERAGWSAERCLGSHLVTVAEFAQLFGTEAPATGVQLSVGTAAVLFTDVVGSTEIYEQHGDARAFALVQRHWRACEAAAARHHGAVLKTLGDGLFCVFPGLGEAAAAASEMMAAAEQVATDSHVRFAIRAAIHEGPCFLVRASERIDLFGTTVNVASRLLTVAAGSQIAYLHDFRDHPGIGAVLDEAGAMVEVVETRLRGLRGMYTVMVATRPDAAVFSTGEHAPLMPTGAARPVRRGA